MRLWTAAEVLRESPGAAPAGIERPICEERLKATRGQCGDELSVRTWEEGRAMTLGQAVAEARQAPV